MAAIILRLSDETLDRLQILATFAETDLNTIVERLIDADPHNHDHRCPTCVRIAHRTASIEEAEAQASLFEEDDDSWLPASP